VVSPLLFAALLVGSQGADTISASVMAVAAAWLTMRVLDQRLRPVQ
jgi:hypothetical protein